MSCFLLAANVDEVGFDHGRLEAFIAQNRSISEWVSVFRGIFLFRSDKTPFEVKSLLADYFTGDGFIVTQVDLPRTGGALPHEIWDWFNKEFLTPEKIEEFRQDRERRWLERQKTKK